MYLCIIYICLYIYLYLSTFITRNLSVYQTSKYLLIKLPEILYKLIIFCLTCRIIEFIRNLNITFILIYLKKEMETERKLDRQKEQGTERERDTEKERKRERVRET